MRGLVVENKKIRLKDGLELPTLKKGEALIKVEVASINPTDLDLAQGQYDLFLKLYCGNHIVKTGLEFSGVIEKGNIRFKKGDKVFGYVNLFKGLKTHQEFISINEDYIALMPQNVSFENAAAFPLGALTSLVALRDLGKAAEGTKLLINGASGGLGVYAIQIAKIFGAAVTAVAGSNQLQFLTDLGADKVIDYNERDIRESTEKFDIIFDLTSNLKFKDIKKILSKKGVFIPNDPLKNAFDFLGNLFRSQKTKYLLVDRGNHEKLTQIAKWIEEGKLKPLVDTIFPLSDYEKAFQRVTEKGRRGRIVMKIAESD